MATPIRRRDMSELESGPEATGKPISPLPSLGFESNPPTHAAFSPTTSLTGTLGSHRRNTILLHQKSPLLLATPPQITRALAYSHPFLTPINTFLGLVSWTGGDPWESFLLVASWWAVVLYGDTVVRIAGPLVVVAGLILGMYGRRFSLLSSSAWSEIPAAVKFAKRGSGSASTDRDVSGASAAANPSAALPGNLPENAKKHKRATSKDSFHEATATRHQKTLDEIVATLRELTARCNLLLEPLLEMTDFLSTQRTATTASTRPALTALFVRLLLCTPLWWTLTLPPLRIITTRRVLLVFGTVVLTWHARVMRVARAIIWRSRSVRKVAGLVTGLCFEEQSTLNITIGTDTGGPVAGKAEPLRRESELTKALRRQQKTRGGEPAGVRFTFIVFENQRRWVGLGWTTSLFGYERAAWTDEHNNPAPPKDEFQLPEVEVGARTRWRWVEGCRWRVDGVKEEMTDYEGDVGKMGWVYYDNKWQNGRRGQDGWGRWTRRRKWHRDAELVELSDEELEYLVAQENIKNRVVAEIDKDAQKDKDSIKSSGAPKPLPFQERKNVAVPPKMSSVTARVEGSSATLVELADTSSGDKGSAPRQAISDTSSIKEKDSDVTSMLSTSSRSRLFGAIKKRAPDHGRQTVGTGIRDRRSSEAASEDADASLGPARALAIQGAGRNEGWGVGDEAKMNLE